ISPALSAAVAKAMSKDPAGRFPDCASFARAALAAASQPAAPPPPPKTTPGRDTPRGTQTPTRASTPPPIPLLVAGDRLPRPPKKSKLPLLAAAGGAAAVVAVGIAVVALARKSSPAPSRPRENTAAVKPAAEPPPADADPRPPAPPVVSGAAVTDLGLSPGAVHLTAGGPKEWLEAKVERRGDGPVR